MLLLNNTEWRGDGLRLLCSTLWTPIPEDRRHDVEQAMNDYFLIRYGSRRCTPDDTSILYLQARTFLETSLAKPFSGTTAVVTHHVPTRQNYPPQYAGGKLEPAFSVEMDEFIQTFAPDIWIYGHHHFNTPGFRIGNTTLCTNQLGYVGRKEHFDWKQVAVWP